MIYLLSQKKIGFPPVSDAESDGLLALGGDLRPERLIRAYKAGIFPWYSEESTLEYQGSKILWWSPDPRCVIFPEKVHVSRSMRKILKSNIFKITVNKAFPKVISHCRHEVRTNQEGTWITDDMETAYNRLNVLGYATSVEAWLNGTDELVGGLYGVVLGKVFFGESMFSTYPNASKAAFITFMELLRDAGFRIVDCQVETEHLRSLGAEMIPREEFIRIISEASNCGQPELIMQ